MALALIKTAAEPVEIRGMTAMLRWRYRWLLRHLPKREAQAVRLLPVLLQASFAHRELRGDPPGVVGVTSNPSWAHLSRAFNLPSPNGSQRGARLISGLLVIPTTGGLDVIAVLERGIGAREQDRARIRLEAVQALMLAEGVKLRCEALPMDGKPGSIPLSLLPFGCLVAGQLPLAFFDRLAQGHATEEVGRLWQLAPTPLSRLALMFLASASASAPLPFAALWKMLAMHSPRQLADPELFAVRWAASSQGSAGALFELASQVGSLASTRSLLLGELGHPLVVLDAKPLLTIGRAIASRLARVVRSVPVAKAGPLRRAFRKEILSDGVPRVLLPLIGAALVRARPVPTLPWLTEERFLDGVTQVQDPSGAVLGQGASREQAWIRALALVCRALGKPVFLPEASPMLGRLGARLLVPAERRTALFLVEGEDHSGQPNDPLNRGVDRTLAIRAAIEVTLTPDGRPSARRVAPFKAVKSLILEATAGTAVEVIAADGKSDVTAARLGRVAARCRTHAGDQPLVIEVAGFGLSVSGDQLRSWPADNFAARPRSFVADLEAWDFGAAAAAGRPSRSGPRALDCLVWALDDFNACVWYSTYDGMHLQERVPYATLEQSMGETQKLVRAASPALVLAVRTAPEIAERISRFDPFLQHVVTVDITGRLPFGLTVTINGERFGANARYSLRAAAETILSGWPPGHLGHLVVGRLELDGPESNLAMTRLYARSLILRRLWAHIRRACRPEGFRNA